jgi:hypothetical protein
VIDPSSEIEERSEKRPVTGIRDSTDHTRHEKCRRKSEGNLRQENVLTLTKKIPEDRTKAYRHGH